MNTYAVARTKRSSQIVTRWTRFVQAMNHADAASAATKILKPKAGQAVWVKFTGNVKPTGD